MRILGIDPGTGITGFGVIDVEGDKTKLVDAGIIKTKPKQKLGIRLKTIYEDVSGIIKEHKPDTAAVEQLFFAQNVTTAISVSHARGVVLLAIEQAGVYSADYTPLQIKQALTGYGRAEKSQVQEMVRTILNLKEAPRQDDAADALAAAICHSMTINNNPGSG